MDTPILEEQLETPAAVFALGLLVALSLKKSHQICLFINKNKEVEIIPKGEHELDGMETEKAIEELLKKEYLDNQVLSYLQGREVRLYGNNL